MNVYNYHPDTGEYLSTTPADPDPLEPGKFLIPAHATDVAPPALGSNETALFDGSAWTVVPDYRNSQITYYDTTTGEVIEFALGQAPDATMSTTYPPALKAAEDEKQRVFDIKAEAQRRIVGHVPGATAENFIVKELNLLMLNAELDQIVLAGGTLTPSQQAIKDNFIALKDTIKTIRSMSNSAESAGDSLSKFIADLDAAGV